MNDWMNESVKARIESMKAADERQWYYLKIANPKIKAWSKSQRCKIYHIECVPIFGESLDVLIFYKTDFELRKYQESGTTDRTQKEYMRILEEIGYIKEFNDVVRISFDSDEHVQRNYHGNYGLRLTDD